MSARYVDTSKIKVAARGRELEVLEALGISLKCTRTHVDCPYPEHGGNGDWRWDTKSARARCTCIDGGDDVFAVVMKVRGCSFAEAKLIIAEIVAPDLIKQSSRGGKSKSNASYLLKPPADLAWPEAYGIYTGFRLGIEPEAVPVPSTGVVGWRTLPYYDPPAKEGDKAVLVGEFPAIVFRQIDLRGGLHAMRIYLASDCRGKASLGTGPDGQPRDLKKSALAAKGDKTSGRFALWGQKTAPHWMLTEGPENAAAAACALTKELAAGSVAIAALMNAGSLERFAP